MRRALTWLVGAGLLAVATLGAVDALRKSDSTLQRAIRNPYLAPMSAPAARTQDDRGDGCSGRRECWARDVALAAGFEIVGNTRSAWIVRGSKDIWRKRFYFWVTRGRASGLRSESFPRVGRLGGIAVFGDGVRFAWKLRRATAWVEAAGTRDLKLGDLNPLVATSSTLPPWGPDTGGR